MMNREVRRRVPRHHAISSTDQVSKESERERERESHSQCSIPQGQPTTAGVA